MMVRLVVTLSAILLFSCYSFESHCESREIVNVSDSISHKPSRHCWQPNDTLIDSKYIGLSNLSDVISCILSDLPEQCIGDYIVFGGTPTNQWDFLPNERATIPEKTIKSLALIKCEKDHLAFSGFVYDGKKFSIDSVYYIDNSSQILFVKRLVDFLTQQECGFSVLDIPIASRFYFVYSNIDNKVNQVIFPNASFKFPGIPNCSYTKSYDNEIECAIFMLALIIDELIHYEHTFFFNQKDADYEKVLKDMNII